MTPDAAPEAIAQAEAWRVNPNTPSTIITPHGRISIGWTVASAGSASDYSLAEQTAAEIVEAMNHRRITAHSAGEGLREALGLALGYLIQNEPGDSRAVSDEFVAMAAVEAGVANAESLAIIARARAALLTPPSDAGSTTRSGGEGVRKAAQLAYRICAEARHVTLGDKISAAILALATTPSPDASPDSGERARISRWVEQAIERAGKHGNTEGVWLTAKLWRVVAEALARPSPSPAIVKEAGEGERLRAVLRQIASNNWKDQSRCRHVARAALSASNAAQVSK